MPTNLPPDFYEVEKRYRLAKSPAEKIACLETEVSVGTQANTAPLSTLSVHPSCSRFRRRSVH